MEAATFPGPGRFESCEDQVGQNRVYRFSRLRSVEGESIQFDHSACQANNIFNLHQPGVPPLAHLDILLEAP